MISAKEIRRQAWQIVLGKWFWRMFVTGSALYLIMLFVVGQLDSAYTDMSIQTWDGFLMAKLQAMQSGMGYTVPSMRVFWQMTGATAFQQFISCIFGSIVAFGLASVMLKAVRGKEERWFAGSFEGFKCPLELLWLMVLMNLRILLWLMLLFVPGIVAMYRYRLAWYLKSDHPDWSAAKCLKESSELMRGMKWRAFCLDLSYVGWFFLLWIMLGTAFVLHSVETQPIAFIGSLFSVVGLYFALFVLGYFLTGRTVFYKELVAKNDDAEARG